MCRECALIVGGLRPKAKPRVCGSKKTVKERRAALKEFREAPKHHGVNFTFFDTNDDANEFASYDFSEPVANEPVAKAATPVDVPPPVDAPPPPAEKPGSANESAAIRRLSTIRRSGDQKTADGEQQTQTGNGSTPTVEPAAAQSPTSPTSDGQNEQPVPPAFDPSVDPFDTGELDEPAEFRKPRPFVSDQYRTGQAEPEPQLPKDQSGDSEQPIATEPDAPDPAEDPAPLARTYLNPDEPVHIHDDPWARTGPETASTAPLPKRRPDPKPIEDTSPTPPDWTKAELPKFD